MQNLISNPLLKYLLVSIGIFILFLIITKIIVLILRLVVKPVVKKTSTTIDDKIVQLIEKFLFRILVTIGLYVSLHYLLEKIAYDEKLKYYFEQSSIELLINSIQIIDDFIFTLIVIFLVYAFYKLISLIIDFYLEKKHIEKADKSTYDLIPFAKKIIFILLFTVAGIIILARFDVDVSGVLVSLGVGSLAIALAAQETLSNMIAGMVILIDRPFRVGDRIRLSSGEIGDVQEIGIRSTKILDFDSNLIIIPNSEVVKARIQNLNYPTSITRVIVDCIVSHKNNIDEVKQILFNCVQNHPKISNNVQVNVFCTNIGIQGIEFRVVTEGIDFRDVYKIQSDLRETIATEFKRNNIELPLISAINLR